MRQVTRRGVRIKLLVPSYVKNRVRRNHWYRLDGNHPRTRRTEFQFWENDHLDEYFVPHLEKLYENPLRQDDRRLISSGAGDLLIYVEFDGKRRFRITNWHLRTPVIQLFCRAFVAWIAAGGIPKARERGLDRVPEWYAPPVPLRRWIESGTKPDHEEAIDALHEWRALIAPYGWYCNMTAEKALWRCADDVHKALHRLFDGKKWIADWLDRTRGILVDAGYYYNSAMYEPRSLVGALASAITRRRPERDRTPALLEVAES